VPASVFDLILLERAMAGEGSIEALVRYVAGIANVSDEAKLQEAVVRSVEMRLPCLRAAGVL